MNAERVLDLLHARGLTLAVAESLTGGLLTDAFVRVPGASAVLRGGVVAYATELKHAVLGVDADLLDAEGPVHPEVAAQMARGAARLLGADVAVSTTGVAGPDPQGGRPVGTVWVGVRSAAGGRTACAVLPGDRAAVRAGAVDLALSTLLAALLAEGAGAEE